MIGLNLAIDFSVFKEYELNIRGQHKTKEKVSHYFFWKKEIEVEYYDRVLVYLNYKDATYFKDKKIDADKHLINPGCVVLKVFKRVPKNDLETLFPNVIPKMSASDNLLFLVPGIVGVFSLLSTKVIPALLKMDLAYKSG